MDPAVEEVKDDLRDDLSKAIADDFDDVEDPLRPAAKADDAAAGKDDADDKAGDAVDDADAGDEQKDAGAKDDAKADEKGGEKPADAGDEPEALEAPIHWPAAERELFAKQPREVQDWALNRHKAMESDYTRKTQEIAPMRRMKEQLDEILGPHRSKYNLQGYDDAGMVRYLVAAHDSLEKDPAAGIKYLAQVYGLDLNALVSEAAEQPALDPRVNQAIEQARSANQELTQLRQEQATQQHEALLNQVNEFADAADDQGNLLHPFMNDVADDIVMILGGARNTGQSLTLQEAYDRACGANPNVRAKMFEAETAKRLAATKDAAERKRREDAEKARHAGSRVEGMGSDDLVIAEGDDLRSALTKAYDAHAGGRI